MNNLPLLLEDVMMNLLMIASLLLVFCLAVCEKDDGVIALHLPITKSFTIL